QQYPANGYFLDIALVSPDGTKKLNVEVDRRATHCDSFGRRKMRDVLRDTRLRASGWAIQRFWATDLRADMDACTVKVEQAWNKLTDEMTAL
ncbi:MAG: DUF559 domain-containing protein, partial [bacterium]